MTADHLYTGIAQLVSPSGSGALRGAAMNELEIHTDVAIAVTGGHVSWIGRAGDWDDTSTPTTDLGGRAVVPALVDAHTHIVWAGDRLADFEARAAKVPYEQILAAGGGIRHTMQKTAEASVAHLLALALPRAAALVGGGAGTIEVKSGYGFTPEAELTSLEAIHSLNEHTSAQIVPTLLIHVPPRDEAERAGYLDMVTRTLIPEATRRRLAVAVDVFIEREAFTLDDARAIFACARDHGLAIKAHVDQFHVIGGVELAIEHGAVSVDHLEVSGKAQILALALAPTVAVVLPGVSLHLGIPVAPARALVDAGAAVAVATDCNPGSSPLFSPQLAMAMSVRLNGLTPAEALTACTANGAAALQRDDIGRLRVGMRADLLVIDSADWRDLPYTLGGSPIARMILGGREFRA
ncbi:MAG: imidazolonepropionase [Gemmatimonadales bacterium]|nr:imidazolonepropionase [Gemmatimonadales bacterium]